MTRDNTNTFPTFSGVVPHLAQVADLGPPRSEIGVGCLMPWAGKLYVLNYASHRAKTGTGVGLRVIEPDLTMHKHEAGVDGTYANRMVHGESNQIVIGPHVIDSEHNVRTVKQLIDVRCCGTARHLHEPARLVYVLGMEGELFELDVHTLKCEQIADLQKKLDTEGEGRVHFKDCHSAFGRLVVCSNDYAEGDWKGERAAGRLGQWDGDVASEWEILERKPFVCINSRGSFSDTMFASGWDRASAILKVFTKADGTWRTYRLPKASHTFDHKWQTEWPRIREVEHERFLMDHHGMWYELSPWAYGNRIWGIKPIGTHLWVHGDFCSWRGMLVVGADNASPSSHAHNVLTAEPQSGLWFGCTEDLWQRGKPAGWGGPWWDSPIKAGEPSDPYLMTGFEHKGLHLTHNGDAAATYTLELDFKGCGEFHPYHTVTLAPGAYHTHVFPTGLSAHWLRLVCDHDATATAQLHYT
ncbi:MAG: hypothetical protein GC164_01380 [Phycisphaera sp.]|nr:hypothetical protein [Phycisphaera sp.]